MKLRGPIVITGFMGCGKSEVARELARRLNLTAIDLDDKVATQDGRTAAELIVDEGEPAFRVIETNTLREVLKSHTAIVIALGGGAEIDRRSGHAGEQGDGIIADVARDRLDVGNGRRCTVGRDDEAVIAGAEIDGAAGVGGAEHDLVGG